MSGRTPSQTHGRSLGASGHVDDFARRNLPPSEQWPDLLLDRPEVVVVLPCGNPTTVPTDTSEPSSTFAANLTWHGLTQTEAT